MQRITEGDAAYFARFSRGLEPDPDLWVDEWADRYMIIPKKSGASEPGPYRTDRTPYAREVMRCLSPSHPCRRVIVKGASQLLKTQVGLNWISASIHQAPANILVLLPTSNIAKRVSHRIGETIKAVPELRERVAEPRSRDSRNTMDAKEFDGGTLYISTAGSASNLAEIAARYVYGDEIDRWEASVDGEGDPIELADARTSTFSFNSKVYFSSSPTLETMSRIDDLYKEGDQRKYYVPCPQCGTMQTLQWEAVKWDEHDAWMVCIGCGERMEESAKTGMLEKGKWRASSAGDGITASFELSALYAPLGWIGWKALVRQYLKAKLALERGDEEPMQVFYNTRLAICWNPAVESTHYDALMARAEDYRLRTVPKGALILTAAVDVQGNRLEAKIVGWGEGMECWVIDYQAIWGSPSEEEPWLELDRLLATPLFHPSGMPMIISAVCVDSGGHHTQEVYQFTRFRRHRKVLAVKGASRPGRPILANRPSKVDINQRGKALQHGAELWMVGTDTAKDWLASRWHLETGPGAVHFSKDLPEDYFRQLTAEHRLTRYRHGHRITEWVKAKADRNEALDLAVYNLAAANFLGLHRMQQGDWAKFRQAVDPPIRDLFEKRIEQPAVQDRPSQNQLPDRHGELMRRIRER